MVEEEPAPTAAGKSDQTTLTIKGPLSTAPIFSHLCLLSIQTDMTHNNVLNAAIRTSGID